MPEKNPDVYQIIWGYIVNSISHNREIIAMALFSGAVAIAKACKTGQFSRWWAAFFEMLLCALIASTLFPIMRYFEIPREFGTLVAIGVGWFGSDMVMGILINVIRFHSGEKVQQILNYTANEKDEDEPK